MAVTFDTVVAPRESNLSGGFDWLALNVAVALIYVALGTTAQSAFGAKAGVLPVWPSGGFALGVFLIWSHRCLAGVLVGAALTTLGMSRMPQLVAVMVVAGAVLPWCAAALLRRSVGQVSELILNSASAAKLLLIGAYGCGLINAALVAGALLRLGLADGHGFSALFVQRWLGDALGVLMITPAMLAWACDPQPVRWRRRGLELLLVSAALLGLHTLNFSGVHFLPDRVLQLNLQLPLIVWAALRFPPKIGWTVYAIATVIALLGAVHGKAPITPSDPQVQLFVVHGLALLTAVCCLMIGSVVAEKRAARSKLRESEEHFRALTLMSSDCYWELDASLRYSRISSAPSEWRGSGQDMIGLSLWDVEGEEAITVGWGVLKKNLRFCNPFRDFVSRRMVDGMWHYTLTSGDPVFDRHGLFTGYRGVSRDITGEMRAREALKQEEERLRTIIDTMPEFVVLKDRNLRWQVANRSVLQFIGLTDGEWRNCSNDDIIRRIPALAEQLEHCTRRDEVVRATGTALVEEGSLVEQDGSKRYFEVHVIPLFDAENAFDGTVVIRRDITLERSTQAMQRDQLAQVSKLNEELERRVSARTRELELANKELEAFSYSVSHDLRAPLRALDGFSRLLVEDYEDLLDQQGRDYLSRIRRNSQRMGELIDDLLELSRVSRAAVQRKLVNLSEMARDLIREISEQDSSRTVQWDIAEGIWVDADPGLMRVLLDNLLRNAWKFTRSQPQARIVLGERKREDGTYFYVSDNGAGFDMAYVGRLFSPFQRLHHARDFEGTGIGLAIVQRVTRLHGGKVAAEGEVGKGATIYFSLGAPA